MNTKLVQLYVQALRSGDIEYTAKEATFVGKHGRGKIISKVIDAEWEVYERLVNETETRKLPEFKLAVKLYKTPLMEALE